MPEGDLQGLEGTPKYHRGLGAVQSACSLAVPSPGFRRRGHSATVCRRAPEGGAPRSLAAAPEARRPLTDPGAARRRKDALRAVVSVLLLTVARAAPSAPMPMPRFIPSKSEPLGVGRRLQ